MERRAAFGPEPEPAPRVHVEAVDERAALGDGEAALVAVEEVAHRPLDLVVAEPGRHLEVGAGGLAAALGERFEEEIRGGGVRDLAELGAHYFPSARFMRRF